MVDPEAIERSSDLQTFPGAISYEEVIQVFRELLKEAEEEVALKTTQDPKKGGAEYWAAQKLGPPMVPGVERRIKLARAVLKSRAILAKIDS